MMVMMVMSPAAEPSGLVYIYIKIKILGLVYTYILKLKFYVFVRWESGKLALANMKNTKCYCHLLYTD